MYSLNDKTVKKSIEPPYATWTDENLYLNNGIVMREFQLPLTWGPFLTSSYKPVIGDYKYFLTINQDFRFEAEGQVYSGKSMWKVKQIRRIQDELQGDGVEVSLLSQDLKLSVILHYLMYPNSPVIRKKIEIKNLSTTDIKLESIDVEVLETIGYYPATFSWIYSDYGRRKSVGPYEGNMQDALVIVHNIDWEAGIVLGNEASGVMKRTAIFWEEPEMCIGLTHKEAKYPFRKWIKANEGFETPYVFSMVYNEQKTPDVMLNIAVPSFVNNHMGIRLSKLPHKPTFVYNTWNPFEANINEQLIMELAKAAADSGMKEFVIDDGWQDNYGDWGIDLIKFPNGLKPVFDYIKSLGMTPGLWVSVGSASSSSQVFQKHPDWFVKGKKGDYVSLQYDTDNVDIRSACFATGWKDYIQEVLTNLIHVHGLEYLKLDFAVVTSPYRFNSKDAGCYSTEHSGHHDHEESLYVNYESMWELFDALHQAKSDLFIDCTFEALGGLQLIDYAMLKHAEGNWLSNFIGNIGNKTDLRIRQMAWWRSPAMPATALVIGNPQMQDVGFERHIQSIAGALPIMLGDPRNLNEKDFNIYKSYADWLAKMEAAYDIMSYRQDLSGFGEPMEGSWDGYQRVNTETKTGGIIGVFRHGAVESSRIITVQYLCQTSEYVILNMRGELLTQLSGKALAERGFKVALINYYDGVLLEVKKIES